MAGTFQKQFILGRLGQDPELRYTGAGKPVCSFSCAVDGGARDEKTVEWFQCVAWDQQAEFLAKHGRKGSTVHIEGEWRTREYEHNGENKKSREVNVFRVQVIASPGGER